MGSNFTWDTSKFENPRHMEEKLQRALYGVVKYWDGPVERHMKHQAPWTDRTTNARNGLFATAQKSAATIMASTFAIVLGHTVDYGIYLEKNNDGKYAIIWPTIKIYAPKVMKTLTKILDRMG